MFATYRYHYIYTCTCLWCAFQLYFLLTKINFLEILTIFQQLAIVLFLHCAQMQRLNNNKKKLHIYAKYFLSIITIPNVYFPRTNVAYIICCSLSSAIYIAQDVYFRYINVILFKIMENSFLGYVVYENEKHAI